MVFPLPTSTRYKLMLRSIAVVIHLGTMIGGHYVAYCLVDPERMFGGVPAEEMAGLSVNDDVGGKKDKKDKRVWCFCSE